MVTGKLPIVYAMCIVPFFLSGETLDDTQTRGVSFSFNEAIISLNLQMTLTKFWIKSGRQCHWLTFRKEMFVNRSQCMILACHQCDSCVSRRSKFTIRFFFAGRGRHQRELFPETTPNDVFLTLAGHCVDGQLINSTPARFLSVTGSLRPAPNLHCYSCVNFI
jgi:hypothetical protein